MVLVRLLPTVPKTSSFAVRHRSVLHLHPDHAEGAQFLRGCTCVRRCSHGENAGSLLTPVR